MRSVLRVGALVLVVSFVASLAFAEQDRRRRRRDPRCSVEDVESYYDHLLVFDRDGRFLLPIGGAGHGPGQFFLPSGVWAGRGGRVYVADMFNGRVSVFQFLGETL